jgi:redox-sensitive bicupin YhaK (pirin superfamily)
MSAIKADTPLGRPWVTADPFLFCMHHRDDYPRGNEHLGPAASLAGRELGSDFSGKDGYSMYHGTVVPGFPAHPHRGFETVTIVRGGLIDHADSLGAAARFGKGDVQWVTAGRGISHSEMFPLLRSDERNPAELFQIWLNLPAADKMVDPHFTMLWNENIPRRVIEDADGRQTEVTVVAGSFGDAQPPSPPPHSFASRADSGVQIWTVRMAPGARFTLPPGDASATRVVYFFSGPQLTIEDRKFTQARAIQLDSAASVELTAGDGEVELLLLQGRPIGEPVAQHGPFVMNNRQQLAEAFADYQRTQFGGWPWPSDAPNHGREQGRFARHADGRTEKP